MEAILVYTATVLNPFRHLYIHFIFKYGSFFTAAILYINYNAASNTMLSYWYVAVYKMAASL